MSKPQQTPTGTVAAATRDTRNDHASDAAGTPPAEHTTGAPVPPPADATASAAPQSQPAASAAPAPSAAPTAAQDDALSGMPQVIELADELSTFADHLHERIMAEIRSHGGRAVPDHVQDAMRALLDDEMLLRQRANSLYADAAAFVIRDLGQPQSKLVGLTRDAARKIRRIGVIGEATGLVGGLLSLAGAAMAGQPAGVVLALDKIRLHNDALQVLSPTPPTAAA